MEVQYINNHKGGPSIFMINKNNIVAIAEDSQ
jgi:hypothetical protein